MFSWWWRCGNRELGTFFTDFVARETKCAKFKPPEQVSVGGVSLEVDIWARGCELRDAVTPENKARELNLRVLASSFF